MSVGLLALLDDVAVLARAAAASLDDVAAAASRATAKSAGVVIDDAAVTPGYVTGFTPDRELPVIWRIARGSVFNKLVILAPAALILSAVAPWVLTPLLIAGGLYLSFEGVEKVLEALGGGHGDAKDDPVEQARDPKAFEQARVRSAIRTDFILSAEIMVIALSSVAEQPLLTRAIVLGVVAVVITAGVYGVVALIVKADDIGLKLAADPDRSETTRAFGRKLVGAMPAIMKGLTVVGTAAMIWVGGGILVHAAAQYGLGGYEHAVAEAAHEAGGGLVGFVVEAAAYGVAGVIAGLLMVRAVAAAQRIRARAAA
jgi:predicted DNA repair protein MutK